VRGIKRSLDGRRPWLGLPYRPSHWGFFSHRAKSDMGSESLPWTGVLEKSPPYTLCDSTQSTHDRILPDEHGKHGSRQNLSMGSWIDYGLAEHDEISPRCRPHSLTLPGTDLQAHRSKMVGDHVSFPTNSRRRLRSRVEPPFILSPSGMIRETRARSRCCDNGINQITSEEAGPGNHALIQNTRCVP